MTNEGLGRKDSLQKLTKMGRNIESIRGHNQQASMFASLDDLQRASDIKIREERAAPMSMSGNLAQ